MLHLYLLDMVNKTFLVHISFLIFSIFYVVFLFSKIPENSFLFIGDQFFRFSLTETLDNAFYLRKMIGFSMLNAWQLTVQTPDIIYYWAIYKLGFDLIQGEKILFGLIIFITLSLSFTGFKRLFNLYVNQHLLSVIIAVTVWYSVNPYLMVLWHGAVYNLGSALTYSLAPLILYYFHFAVLNFKDIRSRIICALLLFAASFTFWMLAALCVFLFFYWIALLIKYRRMMGGVIFNTLKLGMVYLPMAIMIIYPIFHEYTNNQDDINGTFVATFGSIDGGILYQLLMWFSWGIYTLWVPRSIYPGIVTDFYFSPIYIGATMGLYLLLLFLVYKKFEICKWNKKEFARTNYLFLVFITIFFISIFLAKGQEPPFGGIFLFLYENMPFFTVFRSSDHRFGFPAVFALALALLVLTRDLKNQKVFAILVVIITVIQNFIFFSGDLIIGQDLENKFTDRVVYISEPYKELADYLNSQSDTFYILPNPSVEYGTYHYDQNEKHMGQDILPKIINKPFADIPATTGMQIQIAKVLYSTIAQDMPESLTALPIKYILQRKDTECPNCIKFSEEKLNQVTEKEYENEIFTLYKIKKHTPLLTATTPLTYKIISPVRYEVEIKDIKDVSQINFMQSYNNKWKMYLIPYSEISCDTKLDINDSIAECRTDRTILKWSDIYVENNPELKSRAFPENLTHVNSWNISGPTLEANYPTVYYKKNRDGGYNVKVEIFYAPQSNYILSVLATMASVLISVTVLIIPASLIRTFRAKFK